MRAWRVGLAAALLAASTVRRPPRRPAEDARVAAILKRTPLIDGHNDWAEALREREGAGRWTLDLTKGPRPPTGGV